MSWNQKWNPFQKPEPSTCYSMCTCSIHATLLNGFDQFFSMYINAELEDFFGKLSLTKLTMLNNVKLLIVAPAIV